MKNLKSSVTLKQAHDMKKNSTMEFGRLLAHSNYLARYARKHIKEELRNGECVFEFYKADGTLRVARGTTDCAIIPSIDHPTAYPRAKKSDPVTATAFYDLDIQGWRSFRNDSIVYIAEIDDDGAI